MSWLYEVGQRIILTHEVPFTHAMVLGRKEYGAQPVRNYIIKSDTYAVAWEARDHWVESNSFRRYDGVLVLKSDVDPDEIERFRKQFALAVDPTGEFVKPSFKEQRAEEDELALWMEKVRTEMYKGFGVKPAGKIT